MELLTEKQKERKQRDAEVATAYRELRRKCPNASRTRIFDELAKANVGGLKSIYGIRQALINQGALR